MKGHPDDHLADRFGAMDDLDKINWMIDTDGWALEAFAADAEAIPPRPAYAYTVGLSAHVEFPEITVFGLTPAASKGLIAMVADALRGGTEIPIGVELVGLLDNELRCCFIPVDLDRDGTYFGTAAAWYGQQRFDMAQLIYPDRNGFLPYEPGYERRMTLAQPVLGADRLHD